MVWYWIEYIVSQSNYVSEIGWHLMHSANHLSPQIEPNGYLKFNDSNTDPV